MDTVTHALLGTAIAEAGFRSKLGRKSLIAGAIFASLPDSDIILSISNDPTAMFKYHRAATHSLILACIAAPILGWLAWKICKKTGTVLNWILLALLALFSHDLLDLCTTWGTEVLYPITSKRYAIDALPIIDPLILLPLVMAFCFTLILKNLRYRRVFSTIVLIWCCTYSGAGYYLSQDALRLTEETVPEGFEIADKKAIPNTGTILLWHVVLRDTSGNFITTSVSSLSKRVFNKQYFKEHNNSTITQIMKSEKFQIIRNASSDFLLATKSNNDKIITFIDMRYNLLSPSGSSVPLFFFNVVLDNDRNNVLRVERSIPDSDKSGGIGVYLNAIFNQPIGDR